MIATPLSSSLPSSSSSSFVPLVRLRVVCRRRRRRPRAPFLRSCRGMTMTMRAQLTTTRFYEWIKLQPIFRHKNAAVNKTKECPPAEEEEEEVRRTTTRRQRHRQRPPLRPRHERRRRRRRRRKRRRRRLERESADDAFNRQSRLVLDHSRARHSGVRRDARLPLTLRNDAASIADVLFLLEEEDHRSNHHLTRTGDANRCRRFWHRVSTAETGEEASAHIWRVFRVPSDGARIRMDSGESADTRSTEK